MQTYNVKLFLENSDEKIRIDKTMHLQRDCWNFVSKEVFFKKPKGTKEIHGLVYQECRQKFCDLPAQYIVRSYNDVKATYKAIKSNKHEIYAPAKKKNFSVRLDKRLYSIKGNSIFVTACDGKKVKFNFSPYERLQGFLDKKIPCDPLIFKRDGQYWLSFSFKSEKIPIKENKVLGVDVGEKRLFATSENKIFIDRGFNKRKRRLRFLKRQLQSKNTKAARKKLRKVKRKERNQNKNEIHKAANEILKTESNIIALEDLTGIKINLSTKNKKKGNFGKKRNNKFNQIPIAELKNTLTYKAGLVGKRVVLVSPYNTSKNDYRGISDGKRVKTRYYASDGIILDSDVNAAINIAQKYASKNQLPVSFGDFKIAGLDGQAVVSQPNVCKSSVQSLGLTSPGALAQGN